MSRNSEILSFIKINASNGTPKYMQLIEQIKIFSACGVVRQGDVMPPVRMAASELGLNPMTVSKAYAILRAEGYLSGARGESLVLTDKGIGCDGWAIIEPDLSAALRKAAMVVEDRRLLLKKINALLDVINES